MKLLSAIKPVLKSLALKTCPPIRRQKERLERAELQIKSHEEYARRIQPQINTMKAIGAKADLILDGSAPVGANTRIVIKRRDQVFLIRPSAYEAFSFESGDELDVVAVDTATKLISTPDGNKHVRVGDDKSIRVPAQMEFIDYKGYKLPSHLVILTGAGAESWESLGKEHVDNYVKFMNLKKGMTFLEIGCGMGRDAFQLAELLGPDGHYIGVDVTRDSILWCQENLAAKYPNFEFYHFDAKHELYNPLGSKSSLNFKLPCADQSVDRIALGSIFTHLFEDEVLHYMKEIRRVLKPGGLAYATFFLYSNETITAARRTNLTVNRLFFEHAYGEGCYVNDPGYPTGAVAFTDEFMQSMIQRSGLKLSRPYLKGWWSGAFDGGDDGQDVAILTAPQ